MRPTNGPAEAEPQAIALTGATGFIGSALAKALLAEGYRVFALHRRSVPPAAAPEDRLTWVHVDQAADLFASRPIAAVLHLATAYGYREPLSEVVQANILLPLRLLELAQAHACPLFVHTDTFSGKPEFACTYRAAYVRSKRDFVAWASSCITDHPATRFVNARLEHVYGPGDAPHKFVPFLLDRLRQEGPIALTAGDQIRDFIHLTDVVRAYIHLLRHHTHLPADQTEVMIGTGQGIPLRRFVETLHRLSGSAAVLDFGALPHRPAEIMRSVADPRGWAALRWQPTYDLKTGLLDLLSARS